MGGKQTRKGDAFGTKGMSIIKTGYYLSNFV